MYILLIGVPQDPVLQYFFQKPYVVKNKKVLFINLHRLGKDVMLTNKGWYFPCGSFLPHESVGGVYNRMLSRHTHPLQGYLSWLLDECYTYVINRPKDTLTNFSKLWQLEYAKSFGFSIPKTEVIANSTVSREHSEYIFKSISSIRTIVNRVGDNPRRQVHEPVLFQEDKGRKNIRVHTIGGCCYAQEIMSKKVDYRYDALVSKAREIKLPECVMSQCLELAKAMALEFSGIDFLYEDGVFFFLEINPSPGYSHFEKQMRGCPVSKTLYNELSKSCQNG